MSSRASLLRSFFSGDKMVESHPVNLCGGQVLRTVTARLLHTRRIATVPEPMQPRVAELERKGLYIWEDFLPQALFERVAKEFDEAMSRAISRRTHQNGPNSNTRVAVGDLDRNTIPAIRQFLDEDRLQALLNGAERRSIGDVSACAELEFLTQGRAGALADPQTSLHSDIFFTSHKAWFYLTDVDMPNGPLAFVPGSHHLTLARLFQIYKHSCQRGPSVDRSRRVHGRELQSVATTEVVVTCRRNTLVIANTCGYHRRLQGSDGSERKSIYLELRDNPFARRRSPRLE